MTRRRWFYLVSVGIFATAVWLTPKYVPLPFIVAEGYERWRPPMSYPASDVEKDDRPAFRIDPAEPWQIEFGRGSGWHGLDTIKFDQTGDLVLYRLKRRQFDWDSVAWETSTARLAPDVVAKVLAAVESNRLLELEKGYHAAVYDGTQWVLWIQQGDKQKSVSFDNHFPDAILQFSVELDEIISASVGPSLRWRAVPSAWARHHERELWKSIRQ